MMAIGAVDALQDAKIKVPKDVSVIGCDNIFYSGIRRISLTTIDHFVALKGRDACDIIIRKIDTDKQVRRGNTPHQPLQYRVHIPRWWYAGQRGTQGRTSQMQVLVKMTKNKF